MTRADVHEVNVEPVDLSHKLRPGIQLRLHLPPEDCVVFGRFARRRGKRADDGGLGIDGRNGLGVAGGGEQDKAEGTRGC